MTPMRLLGVALAALATFLLGGLWYSPLLFGKRWQRACGLRDDELGRDLGRIFVGSYLLALVAATNLAFFLGADVTVAWGATAGALAGFGWVAVAIGVTYLFERRPLALGLIDAAYHGVSFTLMGAILALF